MKSEISHESHAWRQTNISLEEEFLLEEGLRHVLSGCNRLDAQDLIGTLVRQNFAAQKIIEQASDYIDGLETALLISVRSEDN